MAPSTKHKLAISPLALERCLAKTWRTGDKNTIGRSVEEHCRIAGAVAASLVARFEAVLPGLLPQGAELPSLVHDVGKVIPPFQARLYSAIFGDAISNQIPELAGADLSLERDVGGHAAISHACLAALGAPDAMTRIVGAHHGRAIRKVPDTAAFAGGKAWQQIRHELCHRLLGARPQWPHFTPLEERIVCGLTVTADWIASGPLFDDPNEDWRPLIERAVDEAGFCWPGIRPGLTFEDIFGFAPRPAQRALYETVSGPGVFVLEAPMGLGKTEAALYAAYRMLEQKKSNGLYFALPTQLTSNRICDRVNAFLQRILQNNRQALLLHGMAWLERFLQQRMGMEAAPGQAWFASGRRGILAPFGVGTVDQALLSAMHVRHGSLRTFGLAGKTVILDEVHSYDTYTGTILDALIKQLCGIGCTVIILSATLTASRRRSLLPGLTADTSAYPLISAVPIDSEVKALSCPGGISIDICLSHFSDEEAVEEALQRAEQGERVLWVENTVAEAQERFRLLGGRANAMGSLPVGLLHSRFTPADRAYHEAIWTDFFHPEATGRGQQGGIVVGTQVVEQSLDLDADFLISRFAPTDMLLQRLGRLWRHGKRTRRPETALPQACILHPSLEKAVTSPKTAFGNSAYVYAPYVLLRSLELWHARQTVSLPEDIRGLLEATYAVRDETLPPVATVWRELCIRRDILQRQALLVQSDSTPPGDDTRISTRWQEREDVSVLLFRRWNDTTRCLQLADNSEVELCLPKDAQTQQGRLRCWQKRQEVASMLARNTVRVAAPHAPEGALPSWLAPWLPKDVQAARLVEDGSVFHADGSPLSRPARYDNLLGYMTT